MLHPVTNEEIKFTKEQMNCVNYIGDKRKDLIIRSAAGGGKSLVLIQRAKVYLDEAKRTGRKNAVAIFTYNHVLAKWIGEWMGITAADADYIKIGTLREYLNSVYGKLSGVKLGNSAYPKVKANVMSETLLEHAKAVGTDKYEKWGSKFWNEEFAWMRSMDIFDRSDREKYMSMKREGRGHEHPMTRIDRMVAFEMFCKYQDKLRAKTCFDDSPQGDERVLYLTHYKKIIPDAVKFDHVLIDEAQDQSLANMKALKNLARLDITVCMDANQRIYEGRWTFASWDVDVPPTSKFLSYPFRTTRQIDALAESLIAKNKPVIAKEDQIEHKAPAATGEKPEIVCCKNTEEERQYIIALVNKWIGDDPIHTIGIMCYTNDAVKKIAGWLSAEHIKFDLIKNDEKESYSIKSPGVKLCTIHTSKGLEFMRVILPQFYQGMMPQGFALKDEEKLMQQRNVAYVGMTRAMHQLSIVYNGKKSQFVDEMDSSLYTARTFADAVEFELKKPTPKYVKRGLPEDEQSAEQINTESVQESRRKRWSFS
jgi:hypothetical protein